MKNNTLNRWLWKWHVVAGLVSLPIVIVLSVTGAIYLFKDNYESRIYSHVYEVNPDDRQALSFAEQLHRAQAEAARPINAMVVPSAATEATQFVSGERAQKRSLYVNPYSGQVTGEVMQAQTFMHKVRKLHGELLLGKVGTKFVELIASWLVVLILTGLYVWWPANGWSLAGFFTIRRNSGRRVFFRDLHAVGGFWISLMLLVILGGGLPWTDVFGEQFKRLQKWTDTGYPSTWRGVHGFESQGVGAPLTLDDMVVIARAQGLAGTVDIKLPKSPMSVFTVTNRALWLRDQEVHHFDSYSGEAVKSHRWSDVGFLMNGRQVLMRLHQGEYGRANWALVLLTAVAFFCTSVSAIASYWLRRPAGTWGLPTVPKQFVVGRMLMTMILALGLVLPLFGVSLVLLWLWETSRNRRTPLQSGAPS